MTVIDLGEVRDEPGREEAPLPRPPRAVGRPLRVALALALVVATMAGAAPARQRDTAVVPASPASQAFLTGDRLYVGGPAEGETTGTGEIRAYALPPRASAADRSPALLWRVLIPAASRIAEARAWQGVVLFTVVDDQGTQTLALDAATGGGRWRQPGYPWWDRAGTLVLQSGGESGGTVRSVEPASGRVIWSVRTSQEGAMYSVRDGLIDRIVLAPARGRVEVRDARSGELLHAADLRLGELPGFEHRVAHGLLLVFQPATGVVTAYGLDGLRRRWETKLPLVNHVSGCGEMLCANAQDGGFTALDPATGAVRWTGSRGMGVLHERDGRLLAIEPGPSGERFVLLDAATGRAVADLGRWQLIWGRDDERALVVRPAGADGGLMVAELDAAAGGARVLDVLRDATGDCRRGVDALVCRRRSGAFGVWRYSG